MDPERVPDEPKPPRRKPRASKSAPISEEIQDFAEAEEILDFPEEPLPSRKPRAPVRLDLAMPVLAVAFILFLFSQILSLRQSASAMAWRDENLNRQATELQGVRAKSAELLKQRQALVAEAQRVSQRYNDFLNELLQLAQTNKDARAVVEKFNIKNSAPAQDSRPSK